MERASVVPFEQRGLGDLGCFSLVNVGSNDVILLGILSQDRHGRVRQSSYGRVSIAPA